jgi:nucleotide-binding universal stress UspA family protein
MFKHLLVPLDGSNLAEVALPAAVCLAEKLDATVTLAHIIERNAPAEVHGERHLSTSGEAQAYLDEVAQRAFPPGLRVECHVHTMETKDIARGIVEHIAELSPDLIILCTHGRGGMRDLLFGSIAQQVVARGTTPVLLIQPDESKRQMAFTCRGLLVPLDGNSAHEEGLPIAADLAQACSAGLYLVLVVPTLGTLAGERAVTGRLLPGATRVALEIAQRQAEEYLQNHLIRLQARGLQVIAEIHRGDPTTTIVKAARRADVDIIVLGTHAKAGLNALGSNSIVSQVSSRSGLPVLLVPIVTHSYD